MDDVFDFYGEGKKEFYNKFEGVESVLVQGKHWENAPLVTILLTTYKRCDLLKDALESAINQVGFEDYQVIVVDNEGEDINVVTETAKLMSGYVDDRIIYYRHKESVSFKMDNAVKLAKGKWIVILHDDDILSPHHLKILTEIANKNPQAKYISCPMEEFFDGALEINTTVGDEYRYTLFTKPKEAACLGYYVGWLGALIDRESYIKSGGMPTYSNNLGDYCMVQKFHYKFGIWEMEGNHPLYFRRCWKGQASSLGTEIWTNLYIEEYKYFQYVSKVYHPLTYSFWNRISAYRILDKAKAMNTGFYRCDINLESLAEKANMSFNSLNRNMQYRLDMVSKIIYERVINYIFTSERDRGIVRL